MLGANRQVLRARIQTLRSSDLGIQFTQLAEEWDSETEKESRGGN